MAGGSAVWFRPGPLQLALLLLVLTTRGAAGAEPPPHLLAAVADASRPETDRQRDGGRRPAEVLAFAGVEPGAKVADFIPGKGYFTRILCKAVGSSGHVYAIAVPFNRPGGAAAAPAPAPVPSPAGEPCANVTPILLEPHRRPAPELWSASDDPGEVYEYWSTSAPAESFAAPEPLDLIWTSENYHDLHNEGFGKPDVLAVGRAMLKALKTGGVLVVEDHAAAAGSGARDTQTLHRIEAVRVREEMTAAGFEFVGESALLRNADDPHTAKAHELHDRTDRFLLKFRKP